IESGMETAANHGVKSLSPGGFLCVCRRLDLFSLRSQTLGSPAQVVGHRAEETVGREFVFERQEVGFDQSQGSLSAAHPLGQSLTARDTRASVVFRRRVEIGRA